jgi:RND family efflux transporter MFP subunit
MIEQEAGSTGAPDGETHTQGGGSSHRGFLIAILAVLIVAGIVIAGVVPRLKARAALRTETNNLAVPVVNVTQPKLGSPQQEIVLPGNIQAFIDSPIYARTNGYLKKWYVDIGARVKSGQLLAEIDTPEIDQQLQQARAQLNTAKANYSLSEITANRYQELKNTDAVAKQDVDNAMGAFRANAATVAAAEYQVKYLEQLESFKVICAPFDGVITARNTDIGALITAGSSGGVGSQLFHISATHTLRVYVNVPQQYSQSSKPGLTADLTLAEFPGKRFKGKLVRTADSIDLASRTLLVEVDVDNPTSELLPGAYAEVHLKIPNSVPSYILPVTSLIFRAEGLQIAVLQDGQDAQGGNQAKTIAKLIPVSLGRDFGTEVEVVSGLAGNERVIVNPPDSLITGEEVRVVQPPSNSPGSPAGASR